MFNFDNIEQNKSLWQNGKPFHHLVIDNFMPEDIAEEVAKQFPKADSDFWYEYSNPLEIKKACSNWNEFPSDIYKVFIELFSQKVVDYLSSLTDKKLIGDIGLNGGGLHCHKPGGKLNTHLDYNLHPKLNMQRKLNIIIYVAKDWKDEYGGDLGLWEHDNSTNQPGKLVTSIPCKFNRAVIFDTTQNSWHGLPGTINCPDNVYRKSLAVYYVQKPNEETMQNRSKAWYMPTEEQKNDQSVLDFIEVRKQTLPGAV
jgi:Rps23 Pro-64 3,4-dihydroxylase Tpa1-like proline 4-hydroxylase